MLQAANKLINFSGFDNPEYIYEPSNRRYRNKATGRYISQQAIKVLTLKRISLVIVDLQTVGDLLLNQKISLQDWQVKTAEILKILHAQQFLLGAGGQNSIVFDDYLVLGRKLKEQYKYLRNFASDCKNGISPLQFRHRLSLYAKAAKGTYYLGYRQSAKRSGKTHGLRKLGNAEHCKECEAYAALGLTPIDDVILPTEKCSCQVNCLCDVLYLTLPEALKISFELEYREALTSTEGGYIVDKNGRWRDRNGRFIEMPDINDPAIKNHIRGELGKGGNVAAKNIIRDIQKLKLLNLSTPQAYKATIDKLRSKYKNSPFALSVISSLQLDRGVSNKKNAEAKIRQLEKLLSENTEEARNPTLNQKLRNIELPEVQISPDPELERIAKDLEGKTGEQADKDKAALGAIALYRQSVQELNSTLTEIKDKANLTDDDYNRLYQQREKVWSNMKSALDSTHDVKDDYLSEPVLDEYIDTLRRVSRESPGGFKIVVPNDVDSLKEKAKKVDC